MNLHRIQATDRVAWRAVRIAAGLVGVGLSTQSLALGLGEPSVASVLGQPLQMTVPLVMDRGAELAPECVRIIPGSRDGEPTPTLSAARLTIDSVARKLRVESLTPISEPTLRVVVEVGCNERIRREFALLLDPPSVVAPDVGPGGSNEAVASLGLGLAQISAVLGQRLSIKVPVVGTDASSLTANCVHLADPISSEGAPVVRQADIRVLPQDSGSMIEVATPDPVTEPAVRIALDVGCRDPLRREYAILLGMPTLAASNVETNMAAAEPPAAEVPPKPAPKPTVHKPAADAPIAQQATHDTSPAARAPETRAPEMAAKPPQAPPPGPDRLVLGSPQESIAPLAADSRTVPLDPNAELLQRMDAMAKQINALQAQLGAARQREQELEQTREHWTWSAGALGGLLLGGALVLAWRQRRPQAGPTWEPVVTQTSPMTQPRSVAARAGVSAGVRESSEIGGRATMPPSSSMGGGPTEPPLTDERHTHITVTELHDTVQVIKELYATVLERNTSGAASAATGGRTHSPLELDLRTPTRMASPATSPAPRAGHDRANEGPQIPIDERFTELPTEVALDLDLNTAVAATPELTDLIAPGDADRAASRAHEPAASTVAPVPPAASKEAEASAKEVEAPARGSDASPRSAVDLPRPDGLGRRDLPDDQLTQTPTELSIDIDVGTATDFASTVGRPGPRLHPQRPESERGRNAPASMDPIDLQLDLNQTPAKSKLRSA
jgi:hypothetical protein